MRRLSLIIVLSIGAAMPALCGDVPYAVPPLQGPGQQGPSVPALGDIMGKIQLRHIKIWSAIKARNWDLLDYELDQIKYSLNNAVILYRNIPVEYIAAADKPIIELQKAAKEKSASKLWKGFEELTFACNSCHAAGQVGFISIKTPTSSPFSDQEFAPAQK